MGSSERVGRRWTKRLFVAVALLVVVGVAYVGVTFVQVWNAASWDQTRRVDAVIVLGAAQYNGRPSPVFQRRLAHGYDLWRAREAGRIVVTGANRPGDRFTEAYAGFQYLRRRGVPESDLLIVDRGTSTWESLAASGRELRRRGIDEVMLVSDPYHSLRLLGIAGELGIKGWVSPTSGSSNVGNLARETGLVAVGRIIGYRRLVRLVG